MREIKFRAWDKETKMMYYNVQDSYDTIGKSVQPEDNWDSFGDVVDSFKKGEIELIQYIGAKDKNKKEIYEKDILKTNEAGWIGIVHFYNGRFYLEDCVGGFSYHPDWELCEIIGTIFENQN